MNTDKRNGYQNGLKWCLKNNNIYLEDDRVDSTIRYIMSYRFNNMCEDEATILIKYIAHKTALKLDINDNLIINILSYEEYRQTEQYKRDYKCWYKSINCWYKIINGVDNVFYTPDTTERLSSRNVSDLLLGLQFICHEIIHVYDTRCATDGKTVNKYAYIVAMERIVRRLDSLFYRNNYNNLFIEKHANELGLQFAVSYIEEYNPKLYSYLDMEEINNIIKSYTYSIDDKLFDNDSCFSKVVQIANNYIEVNPNILTEFPILKLGYKDNGKPKDLKKLLYDRRKFLKYYDSSDINELYLIIIRSLKNKNMKKDLKDLVDYLYDNATIDEFVLGLIRNILKDLNLDVDIIIDEIIRDITSETTKIYKKG